VYRLVSGAPPRAYPLAPASLLAFFTTAWQSVRGALANIAIDRALARGPGCSLAQLLREHQDAGVPPSAARVPPDSRAGFAAPYDLPDEGPGRRASRAKTARVAQIFPNQPAR